MKHITWTIIFAAFAAGPASADFLDEFSSSTLDPGWRISWEDPAHWSLTERPGFLRIKTQYSQYDTMWNSFYHTEGISGNFEARAKIVCRPDSAGQMAGIYADYDSSFTGQPHAVTGFTNIASEGRMVFGMINGVSDGVYYNDTLVYLRIRTHGDTVDAQYSNDNSNWQTVASGGPFIGHQVSGMIAMNDYMAGGTPQTPEMNADFDWFHLTAAGSVEERDGQTVKTASVWPNPFIGYSRVSGHEHEYFTLYDVTGERVGIFRGDRIAEGLAPGVYFIRGENSAFSPARIVKIR
jgi:hypothetical protein